MSDSRYRRVEPKEGQFLFKLNPQTKRKKILDFYPSLNFDHVSDEALGDMKMVEFPFKATDTLMGLAQTYYEDPGYWWVIALINGVGCEQEIAVGQSLIVLTPLTALMPELGL